ncbi:MAG TPA: T9SS type A sorting domain-containing protein [Saprospiraceae bacterium]|nr:T9SS type A sorting domain-containing protein [Saprospiraceae bacterium]
MDTFICDNGGFENGFQFYNGEFTNYLEGTGSDFCTPIDALGNLAIWQSISMPAQYRFQIVTSGTDPIVGIQKTKFGNKALLLNNYHGNSTECTPLSDVNKLIKRFRITKENRNFTIWYAVVLENPAGHVNSQPFFSISCDAAPGSDLCFNAGQLSCPITVSHNCNFDPIQVVDWTCHRISIPEEKVGQIATLEIIAADCGCGGHFGYAYIDGLCEDCSGSSLGSGKLYDQPFNPETGLGINYMSCDGDSITVCGSYDIPTVCGNWFLDHIEVPGFNPNSIQINHVLKIYCFKIPKSDFPAFQCRDLLVELYFKSATVSLPVVLTNAISICPQDFIKIELTHSISQCYNNNTNNVMSDDYYFINVGLSNTQGLIWTMDRQLNAPYPNESGNYQLLSGIGDQVTQLGPFMIQEGAWVLQITVGECYYEIPITPPAFCSALCQDFNNLSIRNVTCYPNNTWTFDLTVPTGGPYMVTDLSNNSFTNCSSGAIPCTINGGNIGTECKKYRIQYLLCGTPIYIDVCPPKPCNASCGLEVYRKDLYCNEESNLYYFTLDVKSTGNFLCYKTMPGGVMGPLPSGPLGPYSSDITLTVYECNNAACNCPAPSCFKTIYIPKPDCPRLNYRSKKQKTNLNTEDLLVFPNPSNTGIITLQSSNENIMFELFSIDQKLILPHQKLEQRKELDLRHLPSGLYFLKYLTPGEKMKVVKFILQH